MIDTHYDGLIDWNIILASILLSMSNVLLEPTRVTARILKKEKRQIEGKKEKIEKEKTKQKRKEHFGIEHIHSPIELFNHRRVTICIANGNSFVLSTD